MNSIVIADPHALCREALCDYIRHAGPDFVVHECSDYGALRNCVKANDPDFVLIDISLPGLDEKNIGGELSNIKSSLKFGVIVPDPHRRPEPGPALHAIFPKNLSSKAVLSGICDVLAGHDFFPTMEESMPPSYPFSKAKVRREFNLTVREKEVLGHLAKGASNKDIARALDLQVVTVKLHVRGICRKTGAANRTQAALIAKENGWD